MIKFLGNQHITSSVHDVIVIGSYDGLESEQYFDVLDFFFEKISKGVEFTVDGILNKLKLVDISDMSFRHKIYQIGSSSGNYILPSLPLHRDQIGDVLYPKKLISRYEEQKVIIQNNPNPSPELAQK